MNTASEMAPFYCFFDLMKVMYTKRNCADLENVENHSLGYFEISNYNPATEGNTCFEDPIIFGAVSDQF